MNFFKIIIVIIFFFFSLAANAQDSNSKLINKISKNIRCLVCQGQSIYDSQSDFAISLKLMINKKIEEGYTEEQIGQLWSGNLLRVLDEVQNFATAIQAEE